MYDEMALGRLRNYFHHRTPWQRTLWSVGTLVGLDEVAEYAIVGSQGGANSNEGLKYVTASAARQVETDLGLGPDLVRQEILKVLGPWKTLEKKAWPSEASVARLAHLRSRCSEGYVERWRAAVVSPDPPSVELVARRVAPHLLDNGFSPDFLDAYIRNRPGAPLDAVLDEMDGLLRQPAAQWTVCIPLERTPPRLEADPDGRWISGAATVQWLRDQGWEPQRERVTGGFVFEDKAHDPTTVLRRAQEVVARTASRVEVAFRAEKHLEPLGWAAVAGEPNIKHRLRESRRRVEVPVLSQPELLGRVSPYDRSIGFDDAVELAASLGRGSPGAAIAGGWAAIEGLLSRTGEGGTVAADRAAAIACCAWPTAEFLALGNRRSHISDEIGRRLEALRGSQQKGRELERMLRNGEDVSFHDATEQAALIRMQEVVDKPNETLQRVHRYMSEAFRRLFTQRNLIMHAGSFESEALRTTSRTLPPLVGAVLDRVAWGIHGPSPIGPVDLAARAEAELALVGKPGGRSLMELLA